MTKFVNNPAMKILTAGAGGEMLQATFPEKLKDPALTPSNESIKQSAAEAARAEALRLRKRKGMLSGVGSNMSDIGSAPVMSAKLGGG